MAYPLFQEKDLFSPIKYGYEIEEIICKRKTEHQELMVFNNPYFGKIMVLDGVVQVTERDEYFYHEMLAHVALHAHPAPQNVLIIGGGDGGTLREVLKHDSVKKALVVELDMGVVEASREFLPTLSTGFSDPRAEVIETEGAGFLARTRDKFDVVISDSTDPVGPAQSLSTGQLFNSVFSALTDKGIFVAQTESLHFHREFVRDFQTRLRQTFKIVDLYTAPLTTYAGNWWTFSLGSKYLNPRDVFRKCLVPTRYYSEEVHRQAFLPPGLYQKLMSGE